MQIRHSATAIEVLAPAKINLFFEVLSRRADGFHEIETLMAPISLFDSVVLQDDPAGRVSLQAEWSVGLAKRRVATDSAAQGKSAGNSDLEQLPQEEGNIVVRAIRLLAEAAGIKRGAKLTLVKRIPSAAGLGGGSSDAAATLIAANCVWNLGWSQEQLSEVAAQLGSDVPFFLAAGSAICRGRGEKIERVRGVEGLNLVVVRPPVGLATAAVYGACRPGSSPHRAAEVVASLQRRNWSKVGPLAHNRLLEPAQKLAPEVAGVLNRLANLKCPLFGMSGSGTSCFAVVRSAYAARQLAHRLQAERIGRAWPVRIIC